MGLSHEDVREILRIIDESEPGTVVEVCPENAELVEYGEPLFRVRPE